MAAVKVTTCANAVDSDLIARPSVLLGSVYWVALPVGCMLVPKVPVSKGAHVAEGVECEDDTLKPIFPPGWCLSHVTQTLRRGGRFRVISTMSDYV